MFTTDRECQDYDVNGQSRIVNSECVIMTPNDVYLE